MSQETPNWHARGLLFENCNCQLVCPGHMHFDQLCTHECCLGYWGVRIESGYWGDLPLDGMRAILVYDSPQHMISGGWTEFLLIDEGADLKMKNQQGMTALDFAKRANRSESAELISKAQPAVPKRPAEGKW